MMTEAKEFKFIQQDLKDGQTGKPPAQDLMMGKQ
jgi:hypothetical protein